MLLWYPMMRYYEQEAGEIPHQVALDKAMQLALNKQTKRLNIPKRLSHSIKEIWRMQFLLERMPRHHIQRVFHHPRFRAAYDLLLLRNDAGEDLGKAITWWTNFIEADKNDREHLTKKLAKTKKKRRRRKKPSDAR